MMPYSESRCPIARLDIRPEGEERTPSDSPLYFSPLSPKSCSCSNARERKKRNLEVKVWNEKYRFGRTGEQRPAEQRE